MEIAAQSKNRVPIRLTAERRRHIESEHPEMRDCPPEILQTIENPDFIQEGYSGALMAVRKYERPPLNGKYATVVYREIEQTDGFIITAYTTRNLPKRRQVLWESSPSPESENP